METALIFEARKNFHRALVDSKVLTLTKDGVASNADSGNTPSKIIAKIVAENLGAQIGNKLQGQTAGTLFEQITAQFLADTFPKLQHLRPGSWHVANLGNDYMIAPDIVIYRDLCDDAEINREKNFVDGSVCKMADLRKANGGKPILHASISAKWTMRSDRAQNSRTEALNLIRNRKGHLPHIVVVTGEPLPSRLASLALGTGDVDCVYHFALYELTNAVREFGISGREDIVETLENLVVGRRLKDISDLPLDLSC